VSDGAVTGVVTCTPTSGRHDRLAFVALACILALSAFLQWTTVRETHVLAPGRPDAASYVSYAYNLRTFGVYSRTNTWSGETASTPRPDAVSPPGYPLFLAPFLRDKPDVPFMERVLHAQAALGVLTTLLVFLLARLALPARQACIAALLTALMPQMATISTYLLTEALFTCLLMGSVLAFAVAVRSGRAWQWALAGAVFGACCLVRPTLQLLLPLALACVIAVPRWRHRMRPVALATVCWAMLVMPWFAYQQSIPADAHQPNLLRATLYHGSFPDLMYAGRPETIGYAYDQDPHAAEIMASNAGLVTVVGGRMRAEPLRYLAWYLVGKPRTFLSLAPIAAASDIFIYPVDTSPFLSRPSFQVIHSLMVGLHWPLMVFATLGALLAWVRPEALGVSGPQATSTRVIALMFLSAIVLHMIGAPYPRYSIPFRPLGFVLAVVAAATFARTAAELRRRSRQREAEARA
jgi:4-amino-4-deoxy-L-arabinose transferase-like glycosyltransferase